MAMPLNNIQKVKLKGNSGAIFLQNWQRIVKSTVCPDLGDVM